MRLHDPGVAVDQDRAGQAQQRQDQPDETAGPAVECVEQFQNR